MANIKISELTAAAAATGTQEFEVNDSLTSKKVTGAQLLSYVHANTTADNVGALDAADIGVSVQAYDADTAKTDVANIFTAAQTIKGTSAPGVLKLENTSTSVGTGSEYGNIEFVGNDTSTSANGVRAEIRATAVGGLGSTDLEFYTTRSGDTTLTRIARITGTAASPELGYLEAVDLRTNYFNRQKITHGQVVLTNVDTQIDVDITSLILNSADTSNLVRCEVVGIYNNGAGTYARLHKTWDQHIHYSGTAYVLAGAALNSSYNSDATNFPAGAVNAAKVLVVVSATDVLLRLQNRTTPAAGSTTTYRYVVTVLPTS